MNQKISQLNSLTKSTVATNDVLPIVDTSANETKKITYQELLQPQDNQFAIAGSSDNTKKVQFEVDGLTTGTTRTITIPDASTTMVGTDVTQTLTNKTLGSGTKIASVTNGVLYADGSGNLSSITGTTDQIIAFNSSGVPVAISNPSATDASYSTKGIVKGDTDAATSGLTIASGVISVNSGTTANKIVKLDASAKLPAVDGSQLTNIPNPITYKNGIDTSRAGNASGSTQNIAHGLGKTPKRIRIVATWSDGSRSASGNGQVITSIGTYNGTTNSNVNWSMNSAGGYLGTSADNTYGVYLIETTSNQFYQRAVITCDGTNIILTWTTNGTLGSANTISLMWEAEA